jgi:hypothetical protein
VIETDPKLGETLDQFRDQEKSQAQAEAIRDTFGGFALTGCLSEYLRGTRGVGGGYMAYVAAALEQANGMYRFALDAKAVDTVFSCIFTQCGAMSCNDRFAC